MAILALLMASAIIATSGAGGNDELKRASAKLIGRLELSQDEAILRGQELGLRIREHGYAFQRYNEDTAEWEDISDDKHLAAVELGDEIHFELEIDAQLVVLDDDLEEQLRADEQAKNPDPQIWSLPDGSIEPQFTLRMHRDPREPAYEIKLTEFGELSKKSLEKLF